MNNSIISSHVFWRLFGALGILQIAMSGCSPSHPSSPSVNEEPTTVSPEPAPATPEEANQTDSSAENTPQLATFGGGCFWCVEAVFQQLEGVESVESGYCGGAMENPTYEQVCSGLTGHAEVCQITYDPAKVAYDELLEIFWKTHDPTTLNRQGNDVGTQYRSVVFYHDQSQKEAAETRKRQLDEAGVWPDPIVTEISPAKKFYKAEPYHQNFYRDNPAHPYCRAIVGPKVEKFRKVFSEKLSSEARER